MDRLKNGLAAARDDRLADSRQLPVASKLKTDNKQMTTDTTSNL